MSDLAAWTTTAGEKVVSVMPEIPDDAPSIVREGIARRRLILTGQPCPCGARLAVPNRQARRRAAKTGRGGRDVFVWHEHDCPASTEALLEALGEWRDSA